MKIPNRRELQDISVTYSCDIDFDKFERLYRKYTAEMYSFLVIHTTLLSDGLLRF